MLNLKNKFFLGYVFAWMIGLWLPYVYALFLRNVKQLFVKREDVFFQMLLLFFLVQIFTLLLALFGEHFTFIRWIASLHNSIVFLFLCLGYISYNNKKVDYLDDISSFLPYFLLIALLSLLYFFLTESELVLSTSWSKVTFVVDYFPDNKVFPRLWLFAPYPNAVAIMLFITFLIYIIKTKIVSWIIILAFLIVMFFTGSRIVTLLSLGLVFLFYIRSSKHLRLITVGLVMGVILVIEKGVYELIFELRPGSNFMRMKIYEATWHMWINQGFIFGIGLKPFIEGIPYPLGSHSSLLGYLFRTGIVGGGMYIAFMIFVFCIVFKDLYKMLKQKYFSHVHLLLSYSIGSILIIYVLEDLDAFEVNAFLTGILFAIYFERRQIWKYQIKKVF